MSIRSDLVRFIIGSSAALLLCISSAFAVDIATMDGKTISGELSDLASEQLVIEAGGNVNAISLDRVMTVSWPDHKPKPDAGPGVSQQIRLTDGSRLRGSQATGDGLTVSFASSSFGTISVPFRNVKSLLLKPLDDVTREPWQELLSKSAADDRLVIRKGDVLDFLPGVVTEYNESEISFLYDGSEIDVPIAKVFGIIHAVAMQPGTQARCAIETVTGESLLVQNVSLQGQELIASTGPQQQIRCSTEMISRLDFSLGRVVYLSDLTPEGTEYTPFFDTIWEYQRDRTADGKQLQLGREKFARGLWIHSKTELTYRLAGEYTRMQALMGIDHGVAAAGHGDVDVIIRGDDKVLYQGNVNARMDPIPLDLPLSGKRFLYITVDFGKGLDIGDHLDLVDARLLK